MESLPLLPGYGFTGEDPTLKDFHLKQSFKFHNGFAVCHDKYDPSDLECIEPPTFDPELTYGHKKRGGHEHKPFIPHHVIYHHKVLSFESYFQIGIFGSALEHYRIRRVYINYYLEDDTISVNEPKVLNCGYKQGVVLRRGKVPNPNKPGRFYTWKDLNVGINIEIYGIVYHTCSCDAFTVEFLNSQGVDVNKFEECPADPYIVNREIDKRNELPMPSKGPNLADDKLFLFMEFDRMVLFFKAMFEDNKNYQIYYFLADNTIEICEKLPRIEGGRNRKVLRRTKVPKNWAEVPLNYPSIYQERTDAEVTEYYSPIDFVVGTTVFLFGRRMFLWDCDQFSRTYYRKFLNMEQPPAVYIEEEEDCPELPQQVCPEYPDEHAVDTVRKLFNFPRRLRFKLTMDTAQPEDQGREFVLEYALFDGTIRILEKFQDNAGRRGGIFLSWNRIVKPGTDNKEYYSAEDLYIGARLRIFGRIFDIVGTEPFVYKYMLENKDKFPSEQIENIRHYLECEGLLTPEIKCFTDKPERTEEPRATESICGEEAPKPMSPPPCMDRPDSVRSCRRPNPEDFDECRDPRPVESDESICGVPGYPDCKPALEEPSDSGSCDPKDLEPKVSDESFDEKQCEEPRPGSRESQLQESACWAPKGKEVRFQDSSEKQSNDSGCSLGRQDPHLEEYGDCD